MAGAIVIGIPEQFNLAPKTVEEEIIRNVRVILTTIKGTVALHRDFGIDGEIIDKPLPRAKALLIREIYQEVARYEPRAKVVRAFLQNNPEDGADGKIYPAVELDFIK